MSSSSLSLPPYIIHSARCLQPQAHIEDRIQGGKRQEGDGRKVDHDYRRCELYVVRSMSQRH